MAFFFGFMAIVAFIAFNFHASRRNGHGMVYAAVIFAIWIAALLWWIGKIG